MLKDLYFQMESTLYRETKWLRFESVDTKRKTAVMRVANKKGQILGYIGWYSQWRQYTFEPEPHITFNNRCLQDIADVLTSLNSEHKNKNVR